MATRFRRTSSMATLQVPYYDDFQPISEWKEEPTSHVLTVYLPGFSREQVRVSFAETLRGLRVRGERPLGGNRYSRFAQEFDLPDNSKPKEMVGKFEDDRLIITIPKEIIYQPPFNTIPSPPYVKEDTRKPSIFEPITGQQSPKHPKSPYDTTTYEKKIDETSYEKKQRDQVVDTDYRRTQDEKQETPYYTSKATSARELEKQLDEEKLKDRKKEEKIKEPASVVSKTVERGDGYDYRESYRGSGAVSRYASVDAKRKEIFNMVGETKTTLQRMARDLDEETQLTVNMALAVLEVVGALGAYISYRSTSNRRSNL